MIVTRWAGFRISRSQFLLNCTSICDFLSAPGRKRLPVSESDGWMRLVKKEEVKGQELSFPHHRFMTTEDRGRETQETEPLPELLGSAKSSSHIHALPTCPPRTMGGRKWWWMPPAPPEIAHLSRRARQTLAQPIFREIAHRDLARFDLPCQMESGRTAG